MEIALCLLLVGVCGCVHIPDGVVAVKGFDVHRVIASNVLLRSIQAPCHKLVINVKNKNIGTTEIAIKTVPEGWQSPV